MKSTVSFGPASIVGFLAAIATAIIPIIGELRDSLAPLGIPNQTWIILSSVLTAVTVIGRMYQAGQVAAAGVSTLPDQGDSGSSTMPNG